MNASDTSSDELLLALYRISELSHDSDNLEAFFEEAHSIIADFIYAENFYVCLYDDDNESLSFLYFADAEDDGQYRMQSLIVGVVTSDAFRMKRAADVATEQVDNDR